MSYKINLWALIQNKPWFTTGPVKLIESKNKLYKNMCRTKDTLNRQKLEIKVKICEKYILKLTRQSKVNHFNNFFQENKLNLFKTWEGIREITNITKKETKDINCNQVLNKTVTNPTEIVNELSNHFNSTVKNIEDKLIRPNFDYSKYLRNPKK